MDTLPKLFSSEEIDSRIEAAKEFDRPKRNRFLSDPEQLIESMAALSTSFPHVYKKIELLWGSPELDAWLHRIITETHRENGDKRKGFPPSVMGHLLKIYNIHFKAIGKKIPINIWHTKHE